MLRFVKCLAESKAILMSISGLEPSIRKVEILFAILVLSVDK